MGSNFIREKWQGFHILILSGMNEKNSISIERLSKVKVHSIQSCMESSKMHKWKNLENDWKTYKKHIGIKKTLKLSSDCITETFWLLILN